MENSSQLLRQHKTHTNRVKSGFHIDQHLPVHTRDNKADASGVNLFRFAVCFTDHSALEFRIQAEVLDL